MQTQTVTREEVLTTIAALPADKLAEVYDFARFITERDTVVEPSAEELAAEDALWNATFAKHADKFDALAEQARADIEVGKALPMFDDKGRWLVDDYTDDDFDKAAQDARAAKSA